MLIAIQLHRRTNSKRELSGSRDMTRIRVPLPKMFSRCEVVREANNASEIGKVRKVVRKMLEKKRAAAHADAGMFLLYFLQARRRKHCICVHRGSAARFNERRAIACASKDFCFIGGANGVGAESTRSGPCHA